MLGTRKKPRRRSDHGTAYTTPTVLPRYTAYGRTKTKNPSKRSGATLRETSGAAGGISRCHGRREGAVYIPGPTEARRCRVAVLTASFKHLAWWVQDRRPARSPGITSVSSCM